MKRTRDEFMLRIDNRTSREHAPHVASISSQLGEHAAQDYVDASSSGTIQFQPRQGRHKFSRNLLKPSEASAFADGNGNPYLSPVLHFSFTHPWRLPGVPFHVSAPHAYLADPCRPRTRTRRF